MSLMFVETNQ